jgi:hypothetical protein
MGVHHEGRGEMDAWRENQLFLPLRVSWPNRGKNRRSRADRCEWRGVCNATQTSQG